MVIPVYEIFATYGFLSILPTAVFLSVTSLPFEVYLMKNFIDAVPTTSKRRRAWNGPAPSRCCARVIVPLALPGIAAAAIFGFVNAWGSFIVPLILISPANQQPAPIAHLHLPRAARMCVTETSRRTR